MSRHGQKDKSSRICPVISSPLPLAEHMRSAFTDVCEKKELRRLFLFTAKRIATCADLYLGEVNPEKKNVTGN